MEFKQAKLDNGLTIIAEINPAAASMAAGFFVRTGSRDETSEIYGVSHFLEHMMFKGTDRRTAAKVNLEFDDMGANYNAFTSEENTVFYAAVLPEFQDRLLDLLCDILRPALRQDDFDREKNVILEEIAVYDDQPRFRVYDNLMSLYFQGHPLGQSILGTKQSISQLRREQMLEYFNRRYAADNIIVVGVGKMDFDAFVAKLSGMCSHWQASGAGRAAPTPPPGIRRKIIADPKVSRQHMGLMSPAPSGQEESIYAAQLMATIVGDSTSSRLYYSIVEPAIADEASTAYDPMDRAGGFLTFMSADPAKAAQALQIARQEFTRFMQDGATAAELLAAKNKIASASTLKGELPMGRLTSVGFDWVYRGTYIPLTQQLELMFAVTAEQVLELSRQYDLTQTTLLALGPLEELP